MDILDIITGADYDVRYRGRATVVDIQADQTGARRCVCIRQQGGPVQRVTTDEVIRPWDEAEREQAEWDHAEALADELNSLVPGLGAATLRNVVVIGPIDVDTARLMARLLRAADPLAPFVDAFQAGSPKRYSLDEGAEGFVIRDSFNGGDPVGPPFAERKDAEIELDVLFAEEEAAEALFEAQDRREEIA